MNIFITKIGVSKNSVKILSLCLSLTFFFFSVALYLPDSFQTPKSQVLGVVTGKEGYRLRYSNTTNGGLVFAGNSLCLSEDVDYGSCGTYTSLDNNSKDLDFSPVVNGTTANWENNGGFTDLKIPENSKILYAELIWGGNYKYLNQSVENQLDNSVKLTLPNGDIKDIKPVSLTAAQVQESNSYVRTSGDIKDIISLAPMGKYSLSSVPSIMVKGNPYNNYVGFTLAVAYYNQDEPARNLSLFTSAEQVGPDQFTNTAEVKGFATPTSGKVAGKIFVSAQEGDSMYSGDKLKFGPTKNNLRDLQGPNNKNDNFFASQVNDGNGMLDQSGSFGTKNQVLNNNAVGVRQGWDVTGVSLDTNLVNNQTTAFAQATSTGDTYLINAIGIQIEVNSAKPKITLQMLPQVGSCQADIVKLAITITNNGSADSQNGGITNLVPNGFSLVDGTLKIGDQSATYQNGQPLNIQNLSPGGTVKITYTLKNDNNSTSFESNPKFDYSYTMVAGSEVIQASSVIPTDTINLSQTCTPNQPPKAVDDSSFGRKNSSQTIDVLKNDTDAENSLNTSSLKISSQTSNGELKIVDGKVVYTPNKDFTGKDSFVYEICDAQKSCDKATVEITVVDIQAKEDAGSVKVGENIDITVLNNDIFQADTYNPGSLKIIKQGIAGVATLNTATGKINYKSTVPDATSDTFEYEICLQKALYCSTAIAKITISPTPRILPIANTDEAKTDQSKPVIIDILKNDVAGEGELVPSTIIIIKPTENGLVEVNLETGEIQYNPKDTFSGADNFAYKVCNQFGKCAETTVKILVNPVVPVVAAKPNVSPTNFVKQAFKPIPQVLGVSEVLKTVRTGGNNMLLVLALAGMSAMGIVIFMWLSLKPDEATAKSKNISL